MNLGASRASFHPDTFPIETEQGGGLQKAQPAGCGVSSPREPPCQNHFSRLSHPCPREGVQSQHEWDLAPVFPLVAARVSAGGAGGAGPPSPLEALLLQQALEGGQVPHVGRVVQPGVLAVLDGVVAKLLPQPFLQVTTCAGERGRGSAAERRAEAARGGRRAPGTCPVPSRNEPPGWRRARSGQLPAPAHGTCLPA